MNRAVNAAASEQRGIRSIDDSIDLLRRDISPHNGENGHARRVIER
jgi:hypothetical protein